MRIFEKTTFTFTHTNILKDFLRIGAPTNLFKFWIGKRLPNFRLADFKGCQNLFVCLGSVFGGLLRIYSILSVCLSIFDILIILIIDVFHSFL